MPELHEALSRALRIPMLRWWKRAGSWLLALMLLPVLLQIYALWILPRVSPFHYTGHPLLDPQIALGHNLVSYCIGVLLWLLAALRVNAVLSDYLETQPLPPNPGIALVRLRLSAVYGWPVLLMIALTYRLSWYPFGNPAESGFMPSLPRVMAALSGFEAAAGMAIGMLWVLGILAAAPRRYMLPVVLALFIAALPALHIFLGNYRLLREGVTSFTAGDGGFPGWGSFVGWGLGLGIAALCLFCRLHGRNFLAWSLALLLMLSSVANLIADYLPYWYVVPHSLSFLGAMSSFAFRTLSENVAGQDTSFMLRVMLPLPASARVSYAWLPLGFALNAAFVWLHFMIVQWLLGALPLRREPQAPVRGWLVEVEEPRPPGPVSYNISPPSER